MSLHMLGIAIVPLPLWPQNGFIPSLEDCKACITQSTRAVVLVTPNNPTGAIYPPALLLSFAALAKSHEIALILDETYRDFLVPSNDAPTPHAIFQMADWQSNIIHLFSFSKSYAIPGQRLGAIVGAPSFLSQVATVLDSVQVGHYYYNIPLYLAEI